MADITPTSVYKVRFAKCTYSDDYLVPVVYFNFATNPANGDTIVINTSLQTAILGRLATAGKRIMCDYSADTTSSPPMDEFDWWVAPYSNMHFGNYSRTSYRYAGSNYILSSASSTVFRGWAGDNTAQCNCTFPFIIARSSDGKLYCNGNYQQYISLTRYSSTLGLNPYTVAKRTMTVTGTTCAFYTLLPPSSSGNLSNINARNVKLINPNDIGPAFSILGDPIDGAQVIVTPDEYIYDGLAKTPSTTVRVNNVLLIENTDYIKTYSNNINPGTATITITGINEYAGTVTAHFVILGNQDSDPYSGGGTSQQSDGTPDFGGQGGAITLPTLPTASLAGTRFARIYNPDLSQVQSLAAYMWTDSTFIDTIVNLAKKMLENPIESIISLHMLPVPVTSGADEEVKVLYIPTGVYMPPATSQFVDVDCGSVTLKERYASALDYSPYTQVSCFLPYIGTVSLDTDEVMNKAISIQYRVDIATGTCVAMISAGGTLLYQFTGNCAISLPLTSADFSSYISAFIGAASAVTTLATAGAGAVTAATAAGEAETAFASAVQTGSAGDIKDAAMTFIKADKAAKAAEAKFADSLKSAPVNAVSAVMNSKATVQHAGGFTGPSGYLGYRKPYLIVKRPSMCNPSGYGKFNGRPCMMELTLSTCSGYTEVQSIQLTGLSATNPELSELGTLLRKGVVF